MEYLTWIFFYQGPHSDFAGPTCGSTSCVALIRDNQLIVGNAGDSRCVISRGGQVVTAALLFLLGMLKKISLTV
jgi:hypothetical protein